MSVVVTTLKPTALPLRVLLRRMQARGIRISAAKLEAMLQESADDGVVELTAGGWRLRPEWAEELRDFPNLGESEEAA
jgi:hypothetical protein